jgi:hypothetical protein
MAADASRNRCYSLCLQEFGRIAQYVAWMLQILGMRSGEHALNILPKFDR